MVLKSKWRSLLQEFNIDISYSCEDVAPRLRMACHTWPLTDSTPRQIVSLTTVVIFSEVKVFIFDTIDSFSAFLSILYCREHPVFAGLLFLVSLFRLRRRLFPGSYVVFLHSNSNAESGPRACNVIDYCIKSQRKIIFHVFSWCLISKRLTHQVITNYCVTTLRSAFGYTIAVRHSL